MCYAHKTSKNIEKENGSWRSKSATKTNFEHDKRTSGGKMSSSAPGNDLPNIPNWWEDEWWLDWARNPDAMPLPGTTDEIAGAVTFLSQHFDATWTEKVLHAGGRGDNHIAGQLLFGGRGPHLAAAILHLANQIKRLQTSAGFAEKLKELVSPVPSKASSTAFELSIAEVFAELGFPVSFPPEGKTKTSDIEVLFDDQTVAVECKRLQDEIWEDWASRLMRDLTFGLPNSHEGQDITIDVRFNSRLSEILLGEWNDDGTAEVLRQSFIHIILEQVKTKLTADALPVAFDLRDIASVSIRKKDDQWGSVHGMEMSPAGIFRRILQNGFVPAAKQLPIDRPGIVAVYAKELPGFFLAQTVFDTMMRHNREKYEHVVALLIFTRQYMLAERRSPYLLLNRDSKFNLEDLEAIRILRRQFRPREAAGT
jgi:hypothetical protein